MQELNQLRLVPVVDLRPSYLGEHFYPYDKGRPTKEQLYDFWKETLALYGLGHLEPIERGSDYVATQDLDPAALEILMGYRVNHLEEGALPISLEGGLVLKNADQMLLTPQCCVSLHDYKEWLSLPPSSSFKRIWVGHPWIYYCTDDSYHYFTQLIEKGFDDLWKYYPLTAEGTLSGYECPVSVEEKTLTKGHIRFKVLSSELKLALADLQAQIAALKNRLVKIASDSGHLNAEEIARCLVDGNGEWLSYSGDDPN